MTGTYGMVTGTTTEGSALGFSWGGISVVEDKYAPPGEVYFINGGNSTPFKFSGFMQPADLQLSKLFTFKARDLPETEPELLEFERSISFDD